MAIAIQSGASSTLVAMDIDAALAEDRVVNRMNKVGNISDATSKVLKKQLVQMNFQMESLLTQTYSLQNKPL
jgi:hypothetical protein